MSFVNQINAIAYQLSMKDQRMRCGKDEYTQNPGLQMQRMPEDVLNNLLKLLVNQTTYT